MKTGTSARRSARRSHAFTLLELLVAIAAVALISLGIFQVFRATGETLRTGRRVSAFNAQASLLERQLRDDISRMTRDGFLVIRNHLTNPPNGTSLFRGQPAEFWRGRRTDEIAFFTRGPYTTKRDPVHPGRVARSNEARIYIGHGLMKNPADGNYYSLPRLNDDNADAPELGVAPNQFAGEWTLLRHVTLLCKPREGLQDPLNPPPPVGAEPASTEQDDSDIQIDLQPAASSIFRILERENPPFTAAGNDVQDTNIVRDGDVERPDLASGFVDIATTDLAEIRAIILDAQDPSALSLSSASPFAVSTPPGFDVDTAPQTPGSVTDNMHQWMIESLPADSDSDIRMRYERTPPDLLGAIGGSGTPYDKDYRRTDQAMLTASTLAVGCSEFIVEWSFGKRVAPGSPDEGRLIWHGLEREADIDGDGVVETVANIYEASTGIGGDAVQQVYRRSDGSRARRANAVSRYLVHDPNTINQSPAGTAYSFFGYVDPTYSPPNPNPPSVGQPMEPTSMPWMWPKLLRVTVRLVDPSDPSFEQTYQFIFELPGDHDTMRQQ